MILNLEKLRNDYKAYRKKDPIIAERIDILITVTKYDLKYSGNLIDAKAAKLKPLLASLELSERTVQRWKRAYREEGGDGLGKKIASGRPPGELPLHIKDIIRSFRSLYRWGSEVIQAHLKYDNNFKTSRHKIERYLKNSGLRDKYPCTTAKRQRAQKKNKHTKVVKVNNPGEHTQMDVKYQLHLLANKNKCYVYNFIDHASNWSFKYAYPAINEKNTYDFMKRLIKKCPFSIIRLQTDNGVEFTFKYISKTIDEPKYHLLEKFCDENNINHKLIPPGEKELQGLVERSHRQDDQELFSRIKPNDLKEFNKLLGEFVDLRNASRRFKKLGWMTPDGWLKNYMVVTLASSKLLLQKKNGDNSFLKDTAEPLNFSERVKNIEAAEEESSKENQENDVNIKKYAA